MTDDRMRFVSRSDGQTLFIGPEFFLRPIEPDDAPTAPIWFPGYLPSPCSVIREKIEHRLGNDPFREAQQQRLLICRRHDDRPLGSVLFSYENERTCMVRFHHDPNRSLDERARVESEIMQFILPFLIHKRNLMKVTTDHLGDHPSIRATAESLGMRRCYRLREAFLYEGKRFDRIGYEYLNPFWVNMLGLPRGMTEEPDERVMAPSPVPERQSIESRALRTVLANDRIELRSFEPDDAILASRWEFEETEDFYPTGPPIRNPWSWGASLLAIAEQQPPTEMRFALVESKTQQIFGTIGIAQLDLIERRGKTTIEIFRASHRGQGLGAEAHNLFFEFLFERLGLHMIYAWVSEFNLRSLATTRKRGYREAGYLAWEDLAPNGYCGGFYLDYLASEWWATKR